MPPQLQTESRAQGPAGVGSRVGSRDGGTPQLGLTLLCIALGHACKTGDRLQLSVDSGLLTPDITGEARVAQLGGMGNDQ